MPADLPTYDRTRKGIRKITNESKLLFEMRQLAVISVEYHSSLSNPDCSL